MGGKARLDAALERSLALAVMLPDAPPPIPVWDWSTEVRRARRSIEAVAEATCGERRAEAGWPAWLGRV